MSGTPATIRTHERAIELNRRWQEIRSRRSELKRDLAAGNVHVADVLTDPPEWAEGMRAVDVLLALPRIYRVKAMRTLVAARAPDLVTVGGLTERQVRAILRYLREEHPSVWALWNVMTRKDPA